MMSEVIEQRSEAWRLERAGKLTASRFHDILAVKKDGKPTAAREKCKREIVFERLAATARHEIGGQALRWGTDVELYGKEAFQLETGLMLVESPFLTHPQYPFIGCSPDALIGTDGGYESKCPMDEGVHIETWLTGMPEEHVPQVQGSMFVTGRQWWEFISFDPRMAARFQLYHQRIERDETYINTVLKPGLLQFEKEIVAMMKLLEAKAAV